MCILSTKLHLPLKSSGWYTYIFCYFSLATSWRAWCHSNWSQEKVVYSKVSPELRRGFYRCLKFHTDHFNPGIFKGEAAAPFDVGQLFLRTAVGTVLPNDFWQFAWVITMHRFINCNQKFHLSCCSFSVFWELGRGLGTFFFFIMQLFT